MATPQSSLSRRRVNNPSSTSSPSSSSNQQQPSSLSAPSNSYNGSSSRPASPLSAGGPGGGHKIAYDERDLGDAEEDRITPRLTLMEEVLLLGLKDKQAS
ncbi:hypothetical protein JCM6882_001318, partial [Rhodosporidiobolus microsporus]